MSVSVSVMTTRGTSTSSPGELVRLHGGWSLNTTGDVTLLAADDLCSRCSVPASSSGVQRITSGARRSGTPGSGLSSSSAQPFRRQAEAERAPLGSLGSSLARQVKSASSRSVRSV